MVGGRDSTSATRRRRRPQQLSLGAEITASECAHHFFWGEPLAAGFGMPRNGPGEAIHPRSAGSAVVGRS